MRTKLYWSSYLTSAIDQSIQENDNKDYLDALLNRLSGHKIYFWGGAVRNPILKEMYGLDLGLNDIDIIIDGTLDKQKNPDKELIDFDELLRGFEKVAINRYDLPKWKPARDVEFDVSVISRCNKARLYEDTPLNIYSVVEGCDLTTSAIAYDPEKKRIYSFGAIDAYKKKEVDLNFCIGNDPASQLPRLVMHSHKLGFRIGDESREHIGNVYNTLIMNSDLNARIVENMKYWGKNDDLLLVISTLRAISHSAKEV
ncbi:MAG: hypothetical protein R6V53_07070 [Candidatus Woesearchaeota archaeon]